MKQIVLRLAFGSSDRPNLLEWSLIGIVTVCGLALAIVAATVVATPGEQAIVAAMRLDFSGIMAQPPPDQKIM